MKPTPDAPSRPYRSPVRATRAEQTRRRIATAAAELFVEHGFGGTTVAGIAGRAGVAVPTVYATYGSKAAVLRAVLEQMEVGADAARWREAIEAADDAGEVLGLFAGWTVHLLSSSRALLVAAQAVSDPAVLELRDLGDAHRREALTALVARLARQGALRPGLAEPLAVDRAWLVTGVEGYLAATGGCGWDDTAYAGWLADLLRSQLLDPSQTFRTGPPPPT